MSLGSEDLFTVWSELFRIRSEWYNIGLGLGLTSDTLDNIKQGHTDKEQLREALKEWLNGLDCCWRDIVKVLRKPCIGKSSVARRLEKKYCKDDEEPKVETPPQCKYQLLSTVLFKLVFMRNSTCYR